MLKRTAPHEHPPVNRISASPLAKTFNLSAMGMVRQISRAELSPCGDVRLLALLGMGGEVTSAEGCFDNDRFPGRAKPEGYYKR
jgi:hypothetical protein